MTVDELLKRLVDIDFVNPSLAPGAAGEREIARSWPGGPRNPAWRPRSWRERRAAPA